MLNKFSLIAAGLLAGLSLTAHAGHNGGAGGHGGGISPQHMSTHGVANTNGFNTQDRDKGRDRAAERRNTQAAAHAHEPQRTTAALDSRHPKPVTQKLREISATQKR